MNIIKNYFEDANIILDKTSKNGALFLGNAKSALDYKFILENDINFIVNCTVDTPYIVDIIERNKLPFKNLQTVRIPVYDSLLPHDIEKMERYLHSAIPLIIQKLIKEKKNVLIHCHAGKQRSACVVAALLYYLVDKNILNISKIPFNKNKSKLMKSIIKYIIKQRAQAFTYGYRINFKKSLEDCYNISF